MSTNDAAAETGNVRRAVDNHPSPGELVFIFTVFTYLGAVMGAVVGVFAHMAMHALRFHGQLEWGPIGVIGQLVWQWSAAGAVLALLWCTWFYRRR